MEKKAIAIAVFTAAAFAVACQKEAVPVQKESAPMTVSATTEGLDALATKAEMVLKYDVHWKTGDKICVKNSEKSVEFTLSGGAGTTTGIFTSGTSISGEVEAYYPAGIADLVWPSEQENDQVPPMYCRKTLSSTENQTFNFTSLGSVLHIVFNSIPANVTLQKIEIMDGSKTMSGSFHVDASGKAIIDATDKAGITLDLGEGIALGRGANYFNIAVPANDYSDLTLIFTATNGKKCTFAHGAVNIEHNTVGRLTLTGKSFKADLPDGALPGVFTVKDPDGNPESGDETRVFFSSGNLYAKKDNGGTWSWNFYSNQFGYNSLNSACDYGSRDAQDSDDEIDQFTWGFSASTSLNPVGNEYLKTFVDWGSAIDDKGTWRTLTKEEWQYLLGTRADAAQKYGYATVGGVRGLVILPDSFTDPMKNGGSGAFAPQSTTGWDANVYATGGDWEAMEDAGAVFLPAAGYRYGSLVVAVDNNGKYWSSSDVDEDESNSFCIDFSDFYVYHEDYTYTYRHYGYSVRLVTDC